MAIASLIYALVTALVYYDFSRKPKKQSLKDRCRSIFDPFNIFKIMILYLVLFLIGGYSRMKERSISFAISFVISTFLVFAFMTLFADRLRDNYEARTVSSLWLLPNLLYYNYYFQNVSILKPLFVYTISNDRLFASILCIWLVISGVLFLMNIISHIRFRNRLDESLYAMKDEHVLELWNRKQDTYEIKERNRIPIFYSPSLSTALTVGVIRRNIILVLPEKEYSDEQLDLIFDHELVHICRNDGVSKMYLSLCKAFNFFNPFVYKGIRMCSQDIELSCDENVLLEADNKKRREYGQLILSAAGEEKGFSSCLSADAQSLRYRLENIIKPRKKKTGTILLTIMALLVLLLPNLFTVAYQRQKASDVFFDGDIDYKELSVRKNETFGSYTELEDQDRKMIVDTLLDLDVYEIYVSDVFDGDYISVHYLKDDVFCLLAFRDHFIVFKNGTRTKTYYVKEGIDIQ